MGKIYQWANLVIVWLGEEDELTTVAFRYLRRLALRKASEDKVNGMLIRMMYKAWAKLISKKGDGPKLGGLHHGYLRELLCNPYFQRFWTLQELAMGRSAMVVKGSRPLTWATFAEGADIFLNGGGDKYSGFFGQNGTDQMHGFFGHYLSWMMLYAPINGLNVPLVDREQLLLRVQFLINASHGHQTSNPKDRVFALYNMFKVVDIELPQPDYTKSEATIYREATLMIIRQTASLCIFEFFPQKEPSQPPSWVHNFQSPDGQGGYEQWTACQDSRVNLQLVPSNGVEFPLNGISFGTVSQTASAVVRQTEDLLKKDCSNATRISAILFSFRKWCDHTRAYGLESYPRTREDPKKALFHTIVNKPDHWGLDAQQSWEAFRTLYDVAQSLSTDPTTPTSPNPETDSGMRLWSAALLLPQAPPSYILDKFIHIFWQFYESKRLFVTSDGSFGIGSGKVEREDAIVLLAGATMPMVLRPTGHNFQLIGPAYIHGIMGGEAWPNTLTTELPIFILS